MTLRPTAAATTLACLLGATAAQAEPSVWTQAARPETKRLADALETGDRHLNQDIQLRRTEPSTSSRRVPVLKRARQALESALPEHGGDPDLRFRLGEVYYELYDVEEDPKRLEQATEHFNFVADTTTLVTVRAAALTDLAVCYARLGKHDPEIDAYDRALAVQPHQDSRAILLANRAEGHMVRGDVIRAVRGYRQSLRETPSIRVHLSGVTTLWGLAVALDRSGDLRGALAHVEQARAYDPNDQNLNGPGWFYVPDYDESWYAALGHWSRARLTEDRDVRAEAYREAVAAWRRYINAAPLTDHWLPLASMRLRQCERELQQALRKAPREGR
ncbi:MAG: hypothetical protein JRI68_01390 [Deltaproteobacteria bacterium]|nr:hypothetical protein [Deltaproteobacteria bacterium]